MCATALAQANRQMPGLGFGVWGLGFGVWSLGFGVWGLGFGVWGLGFGFGFRGTFYEGDAEVGR